MLKSAYYNLKDDSSSDDEDEIEKELVGFDKKINNKNKNL